MGLTVVQSDDSLDKIRPLPGDHLGEPGSYSDKRLGDGVDCGSSLSGVSVAGVGVGAGSIVAGVGVGAGSIASNLPANLRNPGCPSILSILLFGGCDDPCPLGWCWLLC